MKSLLSLNSQI